MKRKLLSLLLALAMIISCFALSPLSASAAGDIKIDPTIVLNTIEGWGTSICWWANLVGTWQGIVTDWSREYGESLNPPVENMEVRDALIYILYSPDEMNMNVARVQIGGGDGADGKGSNTQIRRPDSRMIGWTYDMFGKYAFNNSEYELFMETPVLDSFWTKPIDMMQDWGTLYVLKKAAEIRRDAMAKLGKPNDLIVETFAKSPPFYMTKDGQTNGSMRGTSINGTSPNGENHDPNWYRPHAKYMAAATKYIDNYLQKEFDIGVVAVNPFNEPTVGWGGTWNAMNVNADGFYPHERVPSSSEQAALTGEARATRVGPPYAPRTWGHTVKQEGNMLTIANQAIVINHFVEVFNEFGLGHIPVAASGDTGQGQTVTTWNTFSERARAQTPIISTHSYSRGDADRRRLRDHAATRDGDIWQTEVGFGPGTDAAWDPYSMSYTNTMAQADTMIKDIKIMQTPVWVNWIAVENSYGMMEEGTNWGLIHANLSSPVGKKNFETGAVTFDDSGLDVFGKPLLDPRFFNRAFYNDLAGSPPNNWPADPLEIKDETNPLFGTFKDPKHIVIDSSNTSGDRFGSDRPLATDDRYWKVKDLYRQQEDYEIHFTKQFYVHQQIGQFHKQGNKVIQIDGLGITNADVLASISPDGKELIITTTYGTGTNPDATPLATQNTTVDLSAFPNADTAKVIRTMDDVYVDRVKTEEWNLRRMDDLNVSNGVLDVELLNKSVTTYVITNKNGLPLFNTDMEYKMVNTEAMYALNTAGSIFSGTQNGANNGTGVPATVEEIQAYINSGRYNDLNKFNYKRADGSTNGSNVTNTSSVNSGWSYITSGVSGAYDSSVRRASADGASMSFKFDSDRLLLLGQKISSGGKFSVSLDGVDMGIVDTAGATDNNAVLFDTGLLSGDESHVIEITKVGADGTVSLGAAKLGYSVEGEARVDVKVSTPTLVADRAAYLNITVDTDAALTAYLRVNGELLYATAIADQKGRMFIDKAPAAGKYNLVVVGDAGIVGNCEINIVEETIDLWQPKVILDGEAISITFGADIAPATAGYNVTVGGDEKAFTAYGSNGLLVEAVADEGTEVVISGVKYFNLFPSYSFTFTTAVTVKEEEEDPGKVSAFAYVHAVTYYNPELTDANIKYEGDGHLGGVGVGSWAVFEDVNFGKGGVSAVTLGLAAVYDGGTIEFWLDGYAGSGGTLMASVPIDVTGSWCDIVEQTSSINTDVAKNVTGVHDVYIRFQGYCCFESFQFAPIA